MPKDVDIKHIHISFIAFQERKEGEEEECGWNQGDIFKKMRGELYPLQI